MNYWNWYFDLTLQFGNRFVIFDSAFLYTDKSCETESYAYSDGKKTWPKWNIFQNIYKIRLEVTKTVRTNHTFGISDNKVSDEKEVCKISYPIDTNQSLLTQTAVTLKICISDPMLEKPN